MMAVISDRSVCVSLATPAAIGTNAAIVPTLVPRLTVASMHPMALAECAKAPASTKIQIMSIICSVAAPRLKRSMRCLRPFPEKMAMA